MNPPISVEEAWQRISAQLPALPRVDCLLHQAPGRILREEVVADRDVPPFDRVMMDGYALRAADAVPGDFEFRVFGEQRVGEPPVPFPHVEGAAVTVATGCPLPAGADCVVPSEWCASVADGSGFRVERPFKSGQFIHFRASDAPKGAVLVPAGHRLRSPEIGIAASCGYREVAVSRLPRVAILATGDELVPLGQRLQDWQIRGSNMYALCAALVRAGYPCKEPIHVRDDRDELQSRLDDVLADSDFVITTGAISKGARDHLKEALLQRGAQLHFHGVRQQPGKPMAFWTLDTAGARTCVFSLPGNPVSTLVGVHRYVLPALDLACGACFREPGLATLAEDFRFEPVLTCFLPVKMDSRGVAFPAPARNSGDYRALSGTDGFLELPPSRIEFLAGETYAFRPWM